LLLEDFLEGGFLLLYVGGSELVLGHELAVGGTELPEYVEDGVFAVGEDVAHLDFLRYQVVCVL
jgi:hypothetical protein